jgi:hypothetical protein
MAERSMIPASTCTPRMINGKGAPAIKTIAAHRCSRSHADDIREIETRSLADAISKLCGRPFTSP